jgi:hypothetical protein
MTIKIACNNKGVNSNILVLLDKVITMLMSVSIVLKFNK